MGEVFRGRGLVQRAGLAVVVVVLWILGLPVVGEAASNGEVLLPVGSNVKLTPDDAGASGSLSVLYTGTGPAIATLKGSGSFGTCSFADPKVLIPDETTELKLVVKGCAPTDGGQADLTVKVGNEVVGTHPIYFTLASAAIALPFRDLVLPFGIAIAVALGVLSYSFSRVMKSLRLPTKQVENASLSARLERLTALLRAPMKNTGTGWDLNKSWATTFTAVVTAFAGVLGGTDLLTDLSGGDAKGALLRVTVAGLIAALLIGIATMLLKVIGPTEEPTVLGFILGGAVTLGAAAGQVFNVSAAARSVVPQGAWSTAASWSPWVMACVLALYGSRSLKSTLKQAFPEVSPAAIPAPEVVIAFVLAASREPTLTLEPGVTKVTKPRWPKTKDKTLPGDSSSPAEAAVIIPVLREVRLNALL